MQFTLFFKSINRHLVYLWIVKNHAMSVVMEFAIFPTDKGKHVSPYVKKVVKMIESLPYKSQLTPMGTVLECDTMDECLAVISRANAILEQDAERVYCTAKFDNKPGLSNQMEHKVNAVKTED
jgi:uncharacterized protein (TIGR00106 family)